MNRTSASSNASSIAVLVGGAALLWSGQLDFTGVVRVVGRSPDRPAADADELRRGRSAHDAPRRRGRRYRRRCLWGRGCGRADGCARARVPAGRRCLWADRHRVLVRALG